MATTEEEDSFESSTEKGELEGLVYQSESERRATFNTKQSSHCDPTAGRRRVNLVVIMCLVGVVLWTVLPASSKTGKGEASIFGEGVEILEANRNSTANNTFTKPMVDDHFELKLNATSTSIKPREEPSQFQTFDLRQDVESSCIGNSTHPACCSPEQCAIVQNSTMYSACCENTPSRNNSLSKVYPLLVAATPRSGTVFMSNLLKKLDVQVANDGEMPKRDGMVSWIHVFRDPRYDLSWTAAKDLHDSKFRAVWHQVRDPLKCLTSIAFTEPLEDARYTKYLKRHIHLQDQTTITSSTIKRDKTFLIHRGLEFYLQWHAFIVSLKVPIYRLEDLVVAQNMTVLDEIFWSMGKEPPSHDKAKKLINRFRRRRRLARSKATAINKNHREHRETLRWPELCKVDVSLARQLLKLSRSFGYYEVLTSVC